MRSILLILSVILIADIQAKGQFEKVKREEIQRLVSDTALKTHYPKLLERFLADDSTLTNNEYRLLYYGFVFQDKYSGYPALKEKEINEALEKKDYELAGKLCDEVLKEIPINLFANYNKGLTIFLKDRENHRYQPFRVRFSNILMAIISSGDGLSCETAFKTIFVNDEYQVMYKYFEVDQFKGQALVGLCDRMSISPTNYFKAGELYFDTSETLFYLQRSLGGKLEEDNKKKRKRKK